MATAGVDQELERKLGMSLAELELPVRVTNCLESEGITTVLDLVRRSDDELTPRRSPNVLIEARRDRGPRPKVEALQPKVEDEIEQQEAKQEQQQEQPATSEAPASKGDAAPLTPELTELRTSHH